MITIDENTVDTLAMETQLFMDFVTSDDDDYGVAMEAGFSRVRDRDNGKETFYASRGKKMIQATLTADAGKMDKAKYYGKLIYNKLLTGIIEIFKKVIELLRGVIQTVLIPANEVIYQVTGKISPELSMMTAEEKSIFDSLKGRAAKEIGQVGFACVKEMEERMDELVPDLNAMSALAKKALAAGKDYQSAMTEKLKEFAPLKVAYAKHVAGYTSSKATIDKALSNMEASRTELFNLAAGIKSPYYKKKLLEYCSLTKDEAASAIKKAQRIDKLATQHIKVCEQLRASANSGSELGEDTKQVINLYMNYASLCNKITTTFCTILGKYKISSKVGNTGVVKQKAPKKDGEAEKTTDSKA